MHRDALCTLRGHRGRCLSRGRVRVASARVGRFVVAVRVLSRRIASARIRVIMLFSRLLLDENETYLEDRGARYFAGPGGRSVAGRLYLSTRSLFFAPSVTHGEGGDAKKQQVVRITLAKISQLGRDGRASPMGHDGGAQDRCVVRCTDTTYMRPLSPYITEAPVTEHVFALDHHSTDAFLLRVGELHRIAKMPDRREGKWSRPRACCV